MESVFLEYSNERKLSTYRNLPKTGFAIHITICDNEDVITLQGQKPSNKISSIHHEIYKIKDIHPTNQRLYLAGQQLKPAKTLSECDIKTECVLTLKCFISVLVSSLEAPGPMVTEIEVDPKHDETIRKLKTKLSAKLGIDVDTQRLYLAASEMTTYPRRRSLDDISNISRYLSPSDDNNFLELRPKIFSKLEDGNSIIFRVPMAVQDARNCDLDEWNLTENEDFNAKLSVLPHEHYLKEDPYWLSLELNTGKIIKRDPVVKDIIMLLQENLKPAGQSQDPDSTSPVRLKFSPSRIIHGGEILDPKNKCSEDYQMRDEEQQLNVEVDGHEPPEKSETPTILLPKPLPPLISYCEKGTRYTMPKHHTTMKWNIESETLGTEATPTVNMEISAFSYSRLCGSWDIAEHYKTYVEILLEGTFYVTGNDIDLANDENGRDLRSEKFFSQNWMEVTILGPESETPSNVQIINKDPMRWYRKSAEGRRRNENKTQTLDRGFGYAPPFRYDTRPINMPDPTDVTSDVIDYGREGYSKLIINNWYIGKERANDITLPLRKNSSKIFSVSCERGVTLSGNPLVKFSYNNRWPSINREENRRAFDFRVQGQFFVCTLADDFENKSSLANSKRFTICVRHNVVKTEREANFSDVVTEFTSPNSGQMETTISVDLANNSWLRTSRQA